MSISLTFYSGFLHEFALQLPPSPRFTSFSFSSYASGALVLISPTFCSAEGVGARLERFVALSLSSLSFLALLMIKDKLLMGFAGTTRASAQSSTQPFSVLD